MCCFPWTEVQLEDEPRRSKRNNVQYYDPNANAIVKLTNTRPVSIPNILFRSFHFLQLSCCSRRCSYMSQGQTSLFGSDFFFISYLQPQQSPSICTYTESFQSSHNITTSLNHPIFNGIQL